MLPVLALQIDIAWEDPEANHAAVAALLARIRPAPGTLVLLPELFDTGFTCDLGPLRRAQSLIWAAEVARAHGICLCVAHGVVGEDGRGRNRMTFVGPGGPSRHPYEKIHPFGLGGETRSFEAGRTLQIVTVGAATDALRLCPLICYDLRFPELWRLAALEGAEVFLLAANWPAVRQHHWRSLCIARAIENQAFVVAVNRVGADPSVNYAGGSLIVSPRGEVIREAGAGPECLSAMLAGEELRGWRRDFPALKDVRREHLGTVQVSRESLLVAAALTPR